VSSEEFTMIYGIKRDNGWVEFSTRRVRQSDVPTPTTNIDKALKAMRKCPTEWRAEVVKLHISWRKV
jgi:hypothetical protein